MTAVSLLFECCLVFARPSFDRRSTVVRPSFMRGNELEWWGVVISGAKVVQKNGMCKYFMQKLSKNIVFLPTYLVLPLFCSNFAAGFGRTRQEFNIIQD